VGGGPRPCGTGGSVVPSEKSSKGRRKQGKAAPALLAQAVLARYELVVLADTHCHLEQRTYPEGVDQVLPRAHEASVSAVISVGSGRAAAREVLESASSHPTVAVVIGVHPHEAASQGGDLDVMAQWLEEPSVVGVGETGLRQVAAWAPLDRILVETDSPYLAPVPLRGKRCEPAFVVHTAHCLAETRAITDSALAEATTANARRRLGSRLAEAIGL
jgi:Tat protein secretion system quality control protein TatD with DNase activity